MFEKTETYIFVGIEKGPIFDSDVKHTFIYYFSLENWYVKRKLKVKALVSFLYWLNKIFKAT